MLSMDGVQKANSGHPGTPMALAPIAYVLYTRVMRHSPSDPQWPDRDRFVLSCGHASMLLYSVLYLTRLRARRSDDLKQLPPARLARPPGTPSTATPRASRSTTGPLGQGISNAVGMALAERMLAARFNRDGHEIVDHHTYFIASDGDLEEGVSAEASSLAGHLGLGRLIAFYDDNHISIEGDTTIAFSEDAPSASRPTAGTCRTSARTIELDRLEEAVRRGPGASRTGPALIVMPHPHRAGRAAQAGHRRPRTARRWARRRSG